MKAVICTRYGPPQVLKVTEIDKPTPGDKEVLIKIRAATVTLGDCELRELKFSGFLKVMMALVMGYPRPRKNIFGQELSGEVMAVGSDVKKFKPGDKVFASTGFKFGAYAEYAVLPEKYPMDIIPENVSLEEAATIPTGGLNGLHFVNISRLKAGDDLLINGAGGSIGTYTLQIAKDRGARITCVDSGIKLDMLTQNGADHVIDYTKEDFANNGKQYDVIIDIVGKMKYKRFINALKPEGQLVLGNPDFPSIFKGLFTSWFSKRKVYFQLAQYKPEEIEEILTLMKEERIKPVIGKRFNLDQMVEAHQYVEDGLKQGNLIINVS